SSCHCFVLPSMFETFGVVYAEAIACGIPVVATKCGGPEDFVNDSNGLIVPTDDLESVIGAMEYMYKNAKKYDGDKISVATLEKLNEERIGKSLVNIYENLFE
ncbi:MAG: glycosyltransferase, partial [Firmicutes bacterium]|nr:glycosyltransferase [Bacillota bacterium]